MELGLFFYIFILALSFFLFIFVVIHLEDAPRVMVVHPPITSCEPLLHHFPQQNKKERHNGLL